MGGFNSTTAPFGTGAASSRASAADIARLFSPRQIAVIGASANAEHFSGKIVPTLLRQGYAGAIYPVNPKRDEIAGVRCYASLADVPESVDCAIYALNADHMPGVLDQCMAKGVKLLVVASAGFAEMGDELGRSRQQALVERAAAAGIRVLGPNCIGFANFVDRVCLSSAAAMAWPDIPQGHIGLVSQSGGLGLATVLYNALADGIGFSHVVTTGNEADLDTIDVARFLLDDEQTDVLAMTVEAVKDRSAFCALLDQAQCVGKPVVVLKSGRTDLGKVMAASHTGALAGSAAVFEAVCRQYGAVCAKDVDDFYETAAMLAKLRRSGKLHALSNPGHHCAAVSISGGHVGLMADQASLCGLKFPAFSPDTVQAIARELGFEGNFQNPLDTTARTIGDDGFWGRCTAVLLDDPSVEVAIPIITVARTYEPAIRDLVALAARSPKVVLVVWAGGDFEGEARALLAASDVPVFRAPGRAAAALAALQSYVERRRAYLERRSPVTSAPAPAALSQVVETLTSAARSGVSTLPESAAKALVGQLGLGITRERLVSDEDAAVQAASELGYPVVLKGDHPAIAHKSDAGLVALNTRMEADVRRVFRQMMDGMRAQTGTPGAVLVQQQVTGGLELIMGVSRDAEFGPVVMLGMGGIFVEALDDVALRVAPFPEEEALRMVSELRCASLLDGARGQLPVDRRQLARWLVALGELAHAAAGVLKEVDINPVVVNAATGELIALDSLMVLDTSAPAQELDHGN